MKKIILILFMLINVTASCQVEMDAVTTGYYRCYVDGNYVDKHISQSKADLHCAELSALNPGSMVGFTHPDFTKIEVSGITSAKVDTVTLNGFWAIRGQYGNWFRHDSCKAISKVEIDSSKALFYQKHINVLRTKVFGGESLKYISEPFQFTDSINRVPSFNSVKIQTFANEKHCVDYYLNDEEYKMNASCNPGTVTNRGFTEYRHTNYIDSLQPNTEYKVKVIGTSIDSGEKAYTEFYIKTNQ